MDIRELERIEKLIADAAAEKSRAEGALEGIMARLKEEFDLDSLEAAEKELERLREQVRTLDAKAEQALSDLTLAVDRAQA